MCVHTQVKLMVHLAHEDPAQEDKGCRGKARVQHHDQRGSYYTYPLCWAAKKVSGIREDLMCGSMLYLCASEHYDSRE